MGCINFKLRRIFPYLLAIKKSYMAYKSPMCGMISKIFDDTGVSTLGADSALFRTLFKGLSHFMVPDGPETQNSYGFDLDSPRPQVYVVFSPLHREFYIGSTKRRLHSDRFKEHIRNTVKLNTSVKTYHLPFVKYMRQHGAHNFICLPIAFPTLSELRTVEHSLIPLFAFSNRASMRLMLYFLQFKMYLLYARDVDAHQNGLEIV